MVLRAELKFLKYKKNTTKTKHMNDLSGIKKLYCWNRISYLFYVCLIFQYTYSRQKNRHFKNQSTLAGYRTNWLKLVDNQLSYSET